MDDYSDAPVDDLVRAIRIALEWIEELVEEKLAQLQASIEHLRQTPEGTAELKRRVKAFGECRRIEGETSGQFYDKLRHWLHRDIPLTKSPLHPPRQVRILGDDRAGIEE